MATEAQVQKIREALKLLDPANNDHWTDDGLPRTGVVQKLVNDQTIKRPDISAAAPGFERPKIGAKLPEQATAAPATGAPIPLSTDFTKQSGELMTDAEVQSILKARVDDAQARIVAARENVGKWQKEGLAAQRALESARVDYQREFPPLTAAQNVKDYIASENLKRTQLAGVRGPGHASQLDRVMQRSNTRGWRRPVRGAIPSAGGIPRPTQTGASR